jgi:hypothetical protein
MLRELKGRLKRRQLVPQRRRHRQGRGHQYGLSGAGADSR